MRVDCGNQGVCSQGCRPHGCIRFGGTRHNWLLSSNFACNSLRASCRFVLVRDAVSLVFWNCMRNWGRARYWGGRCRAGRAPAKSIRGRVGKENGGMHQQRDRRASVHISCTGPYLGCALLDLGRIWAPLSRASISGLYRGPAPAPRYRDHWPSGEPSWCPVRLPATAFPQDSSGFVENATHPYI